MKILTKLFLIVLCCTNGLSVYAAGDWFKINKTRFPANVTRWTSSFSTDNRLGFYLTYPDDYPPTTGPSVHIGVTFENLRSDIKIGSDFNISACSIEEGSVGIGIVYRNPLENKTITLECGDNSYTISGSMRIISVDDENFTARFNVKIAKLSKIVSYQAYPIPSITTVPELILSGQFTGTL